MDVFDLVAKIRLDKSGYIKGLDEAKGAANNFGSKVTSLLGSAAKVGFASLTAAAAAATAGIIALTKKGVESYATYEQMVGGIETLFGAQSMTLEEYANSVGQSVDAVRGKYNTLMEAQTTAMENADNAYKTAGMSANKYMETITSFAAALKQSTSDEVEAAKVADVAIQDMSDNVSKMGSNMQSVQDAYQGFAKQNYTMLDNLKLGYGGTKTEMERLLADAEKLSGIHYDINNLSDVFNAIHVIQQELGITGTTAKEAMYTIEGSANMTKAAWENVMIAIGKGEGISEAMDNLMVAIFGDESGGGLLNNVIPRIKTVMEGIGQFVSGAAPIISEKIPELIDAILPTLISSTASLVMALAESLPGVIQSLFVSIGSTIKEAFTSSFGNITGQDVLDAINGVLDKIDAAIKNSIPKITESGSEISTNIMQGIIDNAPSIISAINDILVHILYIIASNLPNIVMAGIKITGQLALGLVNAIPQIVKGVLQIIKNMGSSFMKYNWASIGINIVAGIARGIANSVSVALRAVKSLGDRIMSKVKSIFGIHSPSTVFRDKVGKMLALGLGIGMEDNAPVSQAYNMVRGVMDSAGKAVDNIDIPIHTEVGSNSSAYNILGGVDTKRDDTGPILSIMDLIDYEFTKLIKMLSWYFPQLASMQMVLDTGTLVGEIAPGVDSKLGIISGRKGRGN